MIDEIDESKAFAVRVVVVGSVTMLHLLILLHFTAAVMRLDFSAIKEVELILGCMGILISVTAWAFKR